MFFELWLSSGTIKPDEQLQNIIIQLHFKLTIYLNLDIPDAGSVLYLLPDTPDSH